MHPDIVSIGPITIRSYGLMLAIGFFAGILVTAQRAKKAKENPEHIYNLSIWIVISSLIGARLHYVMTHFYEFQADKGLSPVMRFFTEMKNIFWPVGADGQVGISGLILYGGLICATGTLIVYLKIHKLNILKYLDIVGPSLGLGEFFTRIGCFLNGCCFGKPTSLCFGVVFPETSAAGYHYSNTPLHPAQLYNSLAGLTIFFLLLFFERYKRFNGFTALMYFILYAIGRFIIDFFRYYEPRMKIWGLSQNQILSIGVFFIAVTAMIYFSIRAEHRSENRGVRNA
ncbi:MAG TPA: prolipoprotein diacylglyceryl transferase [Anaerolineae bacterium]|nr:prolipoprotein diacylglyceryl transferase [Anaerolineae bacterium]